MNEIKLRLPEKAFLFSVASLLALTACLKLYSAFGSARILGRPDPLLMLTNRQVMVIGAVIELAIVACLVFGRNAQAKYLLLIALNTTFALYRLGVWLVAPGMPCPCLGTVLPLEPATVDSLLQLVVAYSVLGSLYFLVSERLRQRDSQRAASMDEPAVKK